MTENEKEERSNMAGGRREVSSSQNASPNLLLSSSLFKPGRTRMLPRVSAHMVTWSLARPLVNPYKTKQTNLLPRPPFAAP